MISHAIVRQPCPAIVNALTSQQDSVADYSRALQQHAGYVAALQECGLDIIELPASDDFPDSTFIEDVALLTPQCAVLTRPAIASRTNEVIAIAPVLQELFESIEIINPPGQIEAGDILLVDDHYYIGLSGRTNPEGARQLIDILRSYGMQASMLSLEKILHLKTGVSYLNDGVSSNGHILARRQFIGKSEFSGLRQLTVPEDEAPAANCLNINGIVLMPEGYPKTRQLIEAAGYPVKTVNISEFEKLDGGISCLSLRF